MWSEAEHYALGGQFMQLQERQGQPANKQAYEDGAYGSLPAGHAWATGEWYYTVLGQNVPDLTPAAGYTFEGWTCNKADVLVRQNDNAAVTSTIPTKSVRIKAGIHDVTDIELTAHFKEIDYELFIDASESDLTTEPDGSAWERVDLAGIDKATGVATYAAVAPGSTSTIWRYKNQVTVNTGASAGSRNPRAAVTLPTLAKSGYHFTGWGYSYTSTATGVTEDLSAYYTSESAQLALTNDKKDFAASAANLRAHIYKAAWTDDPYTISFYNVDHIENKSADDTGLGAGTVRSFSGRDLVAGVEVAPVDPADLEAGYYDAFSGWMVVEQDGITPVQKDGGNVVFTTAQTIDQATLDDYFGVYYGDGTTDKDSVLHLRATFEPTKYRAWVDPNEGELAAGDAATWQGTWADAVAGAEVSEGREFSCTDGAIAIPVPERVGFTFIGWDLRVYSADGTYTDMPRLTPAEGATEPIAIPHDTIGSRVYRAVWQGDSIPFVLDANDQGEDGTPSVGVPTQYTFEAVFGDSCDGAVATGASSKKLTAYELPTREGYTFAGYFDEAEEQYFATDGTALRGVRVWDKDYRYEADGETVKPHVLHARWVATPAGSKVTFASEDSTPPATAHIVAKAGIQGEKDAHDALNATYNGILSWNSDAATPRPLDTVTIEVSNCKPANGWSIDDMVAAFQDGVTVSGTANQAYLVGFFMNSTGSLVSLSDLRANRGFTFKVAGSDLIAQGSTVDGVSGSSAPSFAIRPSAVRAIYSDTEPSDGPGGEPIDPLAPYEDALCVANFDANGGTFGTGDAATTRSYSFVMYDKDAGRDHVVLPEGGVPARVGYTFLGWSASPDFKDGADDCADAEHFYGEYDDGGNLSNTMNAPEIVDILPHTYYAHWKRVSYKVMLDAELSGQRDYTIEVPFESTQAATDYAVGILGEKVQMPHAEGYLFLGYFTTAIGKGVQYFKSTGEAARAWDITEYPDGADAITLHGRWMSTSAPEPGDPDDPNPSDPFPGATGTTRVIPAASPNNGADMVAIDGAGTTDAQALKGTYEGTMAWNTKSADAPEDYEPTGEDQVAISLYGYEPATDDDSLMAIRDRFEAKAPEGKKHLQGFLVTSTNSFIAWGDLVAGSTVTICATGDDLEWGADSAPASFRFKAGAVEAVYGPTAASDPADGETRWPVWTPPAKPEDATQVYNVFDASFGAFEGIGKRFEYVASPLGSQVVLPDEDPAYDVLGYHFAGWFDANGVELKAGERQQTSTSSTTYYAHYARDYVTFNLLDSFDQAKVEDGTSGSGGDHSADGAVAAGSVSTFRHQRLSSDEIVSAFESCIQKRPGYDFLGFFYRENGADIPFYVNNPGYAHFSYAQVQQHDFDAYYSVENGWWDDSRIALVSGEAGDAIDLYAKWSVKRYTIRWNYDYAESGYDYQGTAAPSLEIAYGERADDSAFPQPTDPGYPFTGWYFSTTGIKLNAGTAPADFKLDNEDIVWSEKYSDTDTAGNQTRTYRSPRFFDAADNAVFKLSQAMEAAYDATRVIDLYAGWRLDTATRYGLRFFFGTPGEEHHDPARAPESTKTDDAGAHYIPTSYLFSPDTTRRVDGFLSALQPATGWSFAYWAREDEDGRFVRCDNIDAGTSGDIDLYAIWTPYDYSVTLMLNTITPPEGSAYEGDLKKPVGASLVEGVYSYEFSQYEPLADVVFPEPVGATGYAFAGWYPCDERGDFIEGGERREGIESTVDYVNDYAKDSYRTYFGAKWVANTYTVTYDLNQSSEVVDQQVTYTYDVYGTPVELPYPASVGGGQIFRYWAPFAHPYNEEADGGRDPYAAWRTDAPIELSTMVEQARDVYGSDNTYTETVNADGSKSVVFTVYAVWDAVVTGTAPLYVNMLFDLWTYGTPDEFDQSKFVSPGYLSTTSERDVRVESLTYMPVTESPTTREIFSTTGSDADSDAGSFALTLKAKGADGAEALKVALDSDDYTTDADGIRYVVTRDQLEAKHGFAAFNANTPFSAEVDGQTVTRNGVMPIEYDFVKETDEPLANYPKLREILDGFADDGSGARTSLPFAKLYYTIGLAPLG